MILAQEVRSNGKSETRSVAFNHTPQDLTELASELERVEASFRAIASQ